MSSRDEWKRNAAEEAAKLVEDGMSVGLGSGTTLAEVVRVLGELGSEADFVAASMATQQLADRLNLNLVSLKEYSALDLVIDGADEVDPDFRMIKGGGGDHTREKILASAAERVSIVVDRTKLVDELGEKSPVPVEVVPFSHGYIAGLLEKLGGEPSLRKSPSGGPFVTDNGNYIIDVDFGIIEDPAKIERELDHIPGTLENGIFVDVCTEVFVGHEGGCELLNSRQDFLEFRKD